MYTTLSFIHRRLSLMKMLLHWAVTFLGNLVGNTIKINDENNSLSCLTYVI
jgi:formate/nitrite transporter FocA (FNT family)